ncbi:uncharacterized protein LOC122394789 [Colletes gigas]|uniref:uncharacterized protein LOC122394789 n=1 Tax=Colletes gigas TaxID=935657 RepID=UPI001C9A9C08|nr:uncharacterized protein LOC122394789 [Colletes gigas]
MELSNDVQVDNPLLLNKDFLQISCNWQMNNNKQFHDAFTVAAPSQEFEKTNFDDIVSLDTCISLQPIKSNEPCMLNIKLTNRQRISRIAIVSEAYVLEFFKEFGEYETTKFAELVDEFEDNFVYFAEATIFPSATEASIKFTKMKSKNSVIWIYGIKLYLTECTNESKNSLTDIFNPEIIKNFLTKLTLNNEERNASTDVKSYCKNVLSSSKNRSSNKESNEPETAQCMSENAVSDDIIHLKIYIDNKFYDMETKVMKRIEEMEQKTNQKLDIILKQLESQFSIK